MPPPNLCLLKDMPALFAVRCSEGGKQNHYVNTNFSVLLTIFATLVQAPPIFLLPFPSFVVLSHELFREALLLLFLKTLY